MPACEVALHKLERLLKLIAALIDSPRPLTAEDIRTKVEGYTATSAPSFHRAFERDKDELRAMGIPLRVETVLNTDPPVTGYRIDRREYAGNLPNFAPDELAALYVAASLVRLSGIESEAAFWKFGGRPAAAAAPADAPMVALPGSAGLSPLFQAAAEQRVVKFDYRGERREVEPHRVSFSGGHWYLDGYDRERAGQRLFRVDRIDGEVRLGEPGAFTRPADEGRPPVLRAWELGDGDATDALVVIDREQSDWVVSSVGDEAVVERRADGSVVLRLAVRNQPAFRSFVLSFLEHAEVLAPEEYRRDLVTWLEAMLPQAS